MMLCRSCAFVGTTTLLLGLASFFPAPLASQSSDEKELAAYRLTMPVVKKVAAVTKAVADEAARDPAATELGKVQAEIASLDQKDELTPAEEARLEKLQQRAEDLEDELDRKTSVAGSNQSIDDIEASLEEHPGAKRALDREGLTAREYAVCMLALVQAALVEGFSQGKADLNKLPAGVNPENVKFVREHRAELEALQGVFGGKDRQ